MFEYRNLWSSVLRCRRRREPGPSADRGPRRAHRGTGGGPGGRLRVGITVRIGTGGTTVTATGDGDIDEWENDILNGGGGGGAPATSAGLVDQMADLLHRALDWMGDLMGVTQSPSK